MRFGSKITERYISHLESLVERQSDEITKMRAQIDDAREIPPFIYETDSNGAGNIYVMNDKRMAREQGVILDEDETTD